MVPQTHSSALSQDVKPIMISESQYEKPGCEATSFDMSGTIANRDATIAFDMSGTRVNIDATITIKPPHTDQQTVLLPASTAPTSCPAHPSTCKLSSPSQGTIAQRRRLSRRMKATNLKQQRSRANLKHQKSGSGYRNVAFEKVYDSHAIDSRRSYNRSMRAKRRACQRVLAKKASVEGSEMWFFGEYKPHREGVGCVVS